MGQLWKIKFDVLKHTLLIHKFAVKKMIQLLNNRLIKQTHLRISANSQTMSGLFLFSHILKVTFWVSIVFMSSLKMSAD